MIVQIRRFALGDETLACLLELDERGEVLNSWGPKAEHFVARAERLKELAPNMERSPAAVVTWLARDNLYFTYRLFDEEWETLLEAANRPCFFEGNSERPISTEDQVRFLLADPQKHWKKGYSAYELAHAWLTAGEIPVRVWNVLDTCPTFTGARLLRAFFEQKTGLRSLGRPSQTDLLVEARVADGLAVIGVEGKVRETFGDPVEKWLSRPGDAKPERLDRLCNDLELTREAALPLRYQLLHRTAATLYEAGERGAPIGLMLVHSFSSEHAGFDDFRRFTQAMGAPVEEVNTIAGPVPRLGRQLFLGWVPDRPDGAAKAWAGAGQPRTTDAEQ